MIYFCYYLFLYFQCCICSIRMDHQSQKKSKFINNSIDEPVSSVQPNQPSQTPTEIVNQYYKLLQLNQQVCKILHKQLVQQLCQSFIQYDVSRELENDISFQTINNSQNYQVISLKVCYGPFTIHLCIYNSIQISSCHKIKVTSAGNYGDIYYTNLFGSQIAIKCIKLCRDNPESSIVKAIKQYFLLRVASAVKVGPSLLQDSFFDLVIYKDCVQFMMQRCDSINLRIDNEWQTLKNNLRKLHSLNIVHLDIKTDNISFSPTYNKTVFIDFGFASYLNESIGFKTKTNFIGSLKFCSKQMLQIYVNGEPNFIDLYHNDVVGLMKILQYYHNEHDEQFQQRQIDELFVIREKNIVQQEFIQLQIKYYLFKGQLHKLNYAFNKFNQLKLSKKQKIIKQISGFCRQNSYQHEYITQLIKSKFMFNTNQQLLSFSNLQKIQLAFQLQQKVKFLHFYYVGSTYNLSPDILKKIEIRQIIFDINAIKNYSKQIYFKLFIDFIYFNSCIYQSTQQQKDIAINVFYHIYSNEQINSNIQYIPQNQLDFCLCFLCDYCCKQPINIWKKEYFNKIYQMIILTQSANQQFLKEKICQFLQNCRYLEEALHCIINIQKCFSWQYWFYYKSCKYSERQSLLDKNIKIPWKASRQDEYKIIQIYFAVKNCTKNTQISDMVKLFQLLKQIKFYSRSFQQDFSIFILSTYLQIVEYSNIASGYECVEQIKLIRQIKINQNELTVWPFELHLAQFYWGVRDFQQIRRIYNKFIKIMNYGELVDKLMIKTIVITMQYLQNTITFEQYVNRLFIFYSKSNRTLKTNINIQQIYQIVNIINYNSQLQTKYSGLSEKINFLCSSIDISQQYLFYSYMGNWTSLNHLYYQINRNDSNIISKMQQKYAIFYSTAQLLQMIQNADQLSCILLLIRTYIQYRKGNIVQAMQSYDRIINDHIEKSYLRKFAVDAITLKIWISLQHQNFMNQNNIQFLLKLCRKVNCTNQYFLLGNSDLFIQITSQFLLTTDLKQFINFAYQLTLVFKSFPSTINMNVFYRQFRAALALIKNNSKQINNLIEIITQNYRFSCYKQNPYFSLFYSLIIKLQTLISKQWMFRKIALSLTQIQKHAHLVILHDFYFYLAVNEINVKKRYFLRKKHFKNGLHIFKIYQIYTFYLSDFNIKMQANQILQVMKQKIKLYFTNGDNLVQKYQK